MNPDPECIQCDGNGYYRGGAAEEYDIVSCACDDQEPKAVTKMKPDPNCGTCHGRGYYTGGPDMGFDDIDCGCIYRKPPTMSPAAAAELVGYLKENLTLNVEFEAYHYGRENRLTVTVKIGDEVITESTCRVEPTTSDGY